MSNFPMKFKKLLDSSGFMEEADGFSIEDLKAAIVTAEKNIYVVEKEKEENEKLKVLKEDLKAIMSAYSDAKKFQNAKMQYCLHLLESKGEIDTPENREE